MEWLEQVDKELCEIYEGSPKRCGIKVGTWEGIPIEKFSQKALWGMIIEMGQLNRMEKERTAQSYDFLLDLARARRKDR